MGSETVELDSDWFFTDSILSYSCSCGKSLDRLRGFGIFYLIWLSFFYFLADCLNKFLPIPWRYEAESLIKDHLNSFRR